jgi:hypothetical protein
MTQGGGVVSSEGIILFLVLDGAPIPSKHIHL